MESKSPSRVRAAGKFWECRLWFYSTQVLDAVVRDPVEQEHQRREIESANTSFSFFVRRALDAYLKHLAAGGRVEKEPARVPADPRTSATLKCYSDAPASLRRRLADYLRTIPPRNGLAWPHGSQRSSVVRQALRWWVRRHPA